MLKNFGHFFNRNQSDKEFFRNLEELNLPDEAYLMESVSRLEQASQRERYPAQVGLYEKLLQCDLLLPVPVGADLHRGIPVIALENSQGEKGLPVFTTERNLLLWADETANFIGVPFTTLCGFAVETGVDYLIINVAGPCGCEISLHDFSYLAEGLLPPPISDQDGRKAGEVVIEKNTPMRLAKCSGLSPSLMDRLHHIFHTHDRLIDSVYLFDVGFNEGPLQPALGIRMPDGTEEEWEMQLWPTMQAVLCEMLERREVVNVFLLNQAASMEFHVQELTPPIYKAHA